VRQCHSHCAHVGEVFANLLRHGVLGMVAVGVFVDVRGRRSHSFDIRCDVNGAHHRAQIRGHGRPQCDQGACFSPHEG
jgi:hypothetical protein